MFTKHILIDDAIAAFKPYSGIAGNAAGMVFSGLAADRL